MASGNYRVERKYSWFTGREMAPAGKCSTKRCECDAAVFVASDYVTGRRGRVSTRYVGYCAAHAQKVVAKHASDTPPQPKTLAQAVALLRYQDPQQPKTDQA